MGRRKKAAAPPPHPAVKVFRVLAAEFSAVDDGTVSSWLELTEPLVSKKRFGKLYDQALSLLAAHRMKVSGAFDEAAGEEGGVLGSVAGSLRVASYSEGETSISFRNSTSAVSEESSELSLTAYGTQYMTLMRRVIVPIMSSGEAR